MRSNAVMRRLGVALLAMTAAVAPAAVGGQTSTASLRGYVLGPGGTPVVDARVEVQDTASGIRRGTVTNASGFYNVSALTPGTYAVRVTRIGFAPQQRTVRLGVGSTVTSDFSVAEVAAQLGTVVVVEEAGVGVRTPEVATNVTTQQIENLPQGNRNFLDFATLAPGIQTRQAGISAGGASASNANLFIDGVSFKSDVLPGGITGQDPSIARRTGAGAVVGNPFPQSAVQEFRVLTQNYKAEYQKASGAVITTATKSGTNELHGDLFYNTLNDTWIARNDFQRRTSLDVPNFFRSQFGGSIGGPIIRDRAHYFASYERNVQETDTRVVFRTPLGTPVPAPITAGGGEFDQPFSSHLFFGKATYAVNDQNTLMLTTTVRNEDDERGFGDNSAASLRERIDNDVYSVLLKHTLSGQPFTNEAQINFQRFNWKQVPENSDLPRLVYRFPGGGVPDIIRGGNLSFQDFSQDRISLRNDLTYPMATHVFKVGVNVDFLDYNVDKRLDETPTFFFATDAPGGLTTPYEANLQIGDPGLETNNRQYGAYIQDDWTVNQRLTLNFGVRWDYETNWLNNDHVTNPEYADSVRQFLGDHPYFAEEDYITDGDDRKDFWKAFQPRVGFSYDATGDNRTVIFGGGGVYFDRINYNVLLDEKYKVQRPRYTFRFVPPGTTPVPAGSIEWDDAFFERENLIELVGNAGFPEVFLIKNDQDPPYTIQTSLGVRHSLGDYQLGVTGTLVNGYNYFKWIWGNRDPVTNDLFFGQRGIGAILISNDDVRSWYRGLLFQLSKQFAGDARWGGDLSYTLSQTETNDFQDVEDAFALDYIPGHPTLGFDRQPGRFDERHRVVLNLITEIPFGIRLSTLTTLGSGLPYTLTTGCTSPTPAAGSFCASQPVPARFIPDFLANPAGERWRSARPESKWFGPFGKWAYRNVDLRLAKSVVVGRETLSITFDVLNVFNFTNYNFSNNFVYNVEPLLNPASTGTLGPRHPMGEFDTYDSRRMQLGMRYAF